MSKRKYKWRPSVLSDQEIAEARSKQTERGRKQDERLKAGNVVARHTGRGGEHVKWRNAPNRSDIFGVDYPGNLLPPKKPKESGKAKPKKKTRPPTPKRPAASKPKEKPDPATRKPKRGELPAASATGKYPYRIIGGNAEKRRSVDAVLRQNFTDSELKATDGLVIEIGKGGAAARGAAGFYIHKAGFSVGGRMAMSKKAASLPGVKHYIKIGGDYAHGTTVTHEMIHHVRSQRGQGITGRQRNTASFMFDHDIEESTTDLETVSRHNPYMERGTNRVGRPDRTGYYGYAIPKKYRGNMKTMQAWDEQQRLTREAELTDRALITLTPDKKKATALARSKDQSLRDSGLRPDPLTDNIRKRYGKTLISGMAMKGGPSARKKAGIIGKAENVDQYFAVIGKKGDIKSQIHVRTDARNRDVSKSVARKIAPGLQPGRKLVSFHDGRRRQLAKSAFTR